MSKQVLRRSQDRGGDAPATRSRDGCATAKMHCPRWRSEYSVRTNASCNRRIMTASTGVASEQPSGQPLRRISILGVPVAAATYDSALQCVKELAKQPRPTAVCPANTHILAEARHSAEFARTLSKFDLVLPDGMPIRWALNRCGAGLTDRVYGPYFMRHTLRNTPRPWRHFFFGDSEACLADLRQVAKELNPDIDIVGAISPPFRPLTEADEESFASTINAAEPDFVWVALPGVRMERWIVENQRRHKHGVFLAVGDAFTLLTGRRAFAPRWMQKSGLTWAYRLSHEPARLGPRYVRYNLLYLYYTLRERMRGGAAVG
jgi:N-acetylglucosaminyldiphosphoundecaprenol N-acetyl-beta-D-mannosaminyltransferase